MPIASQSFGYILNCVNPGIVFTSLINTSFVSVKKKSQRVKPLPSMARNAVTAYSRILAETSSGIAAGFEELWCC